MNWQELQTVQEIRCVEEVQVLSTVQVDPEPIFSNPFGNLIELECF